MKDKENQNVFEDIKLGLEQAIEYEKKQKQIKEMADIYMSNMQAEFDKIGATTTERQMYINELYLNVLKLCGVFIGAGYRKLPEDSVVLTREEYEKLKTQLKIKTNEADWRADQLQALDKDFELLEKVVRCKDCKWSTRLEQQNNTRKNRIIEYNGEKLTLSEMARKYNIYPTTLCSRLKRWKDIKKCIETPIQTNKIRCKNKKGGN